MTTEVVSALDLYRDIKSSAAYKLEPADIAEMVRVLSIYWLETRRGVYMKGVRGAEDWLEFEHRMWTLGEDLRELFKKNKKWRGKNDLNDLIALVLLDSAFGKGRQTFALLLGNYGIGGEYDSVLGKVLSDNQVCGHAIKSLNKLKADGYCQPVLNILKEKHPTWIKKAAKKYIKSFCSE